jgi:nitroreductase
MKRRQVLVGGGILALAAAGGAYAGIRRMGSMEEYDSAVAATRAALVVRPQMRDLIRYATLAPNGHNTQPWRFRIGKDRIDVLPDHSRRTPVVDPDDHHLFVSLGAAMENLSLAAGAGGQTGDIAFEPADGGSMAFAFGEGPAVDRALFEAIPLRQSTRSEYDGRQLSANDLQKLIGAASVPGVDLVLVTDRPKMDQIGDLVVAGNSAQMADAAYMAELKSWLRFSPRQAMVTGDGLFSGASGNPILPAWLGPPMLDLVYRASAENDKIARQLRSSSGIAVFVSHQADPDHWARAGRASQRFALQATALGLKICFINQPVEVAKLRPALADLVGLPGRRPDLVMRFGYGNALPYSARRPLDAVLA